MRPRARKLFRTFRAKGLLDAKLGSPADIIMKQDAVLFFERERPSFPEPLENSLERKKLSTARAKGTAAAKCRVVLRQLSYKHTLQPAFPSSFCLVPSFSSLTFQRSLCL